VGSSPIARSRTARDGGFYNLMATWPSGKARVCKTLIMGSNPIVASFVLMLRRYRCPPLVSAPPWPWLKPAVSCLPHFYPESGEVKWLIPGGTLEFCECLPLGALREFTEETGFQAEVTGLLDVSEVLQPEKPYHSITITYWGKITGGVLRPE
jgi:8-oxo-dGTP pyrophosphatase MutT (NUDIX family)